MDGGREVSHGATEQDVGSATGDARAVLHTMDPQCHLQSLEGRTRSAAVWMLLECALAGYGRIRVIAGRRSLATQWRLYGRGRTASECESVGVPARYSRPGGRRVRWCLAERLAHVEGEAFDVNVRMYAESEWERIGAIGERCGLDWGGRWEVKDNVHFQLRA